jgi:transcriptional regulator with XRE-family HTH domain
MRKRTDNAARKEFIRRLRLAMDQAGISQNELARRTNQSSQAVSDQLTKSSLPGGEAMIRLPEALGISGHWLLCGAGSMAPPDDGRMDRAFTMGGQAALADAREMLTGLERSWRDRGGGSSDGPSLRRTPMAARKNG